MFKELFAQNGKSKNPEGSANALPGELKPPEGPARAKAGPAKKSPWNKSSIPDITAQIEKSQTEMTKRLEELIDSKMQVVKTNTDATKSLEAKIGKMEQTISLDKKGMDDLKERLDKIDETVLELSSLYEVVSSTVNPFVSDNLNPSNEKMAEIEKKIAELNKNALNSTISEDLDQRLMALEKSIEELKKSVRPDPKKEDALVQKIAGIVAERIKPATGQAAEDGSTASLATTQQTSESPLFQNSNHEVRLSQLDNKPETPIILLNWIEFLMEKVGRNNIVDVLEYYVEIGWISEEVSSKIIDYANGIDYYVERPTWKLLPEDHTRSLFFIEQLRGHKIDKNSLAKLERDVGKIVRSSEPLVSSNKLEL